MSQAPQDLVRTLLGVVFIGALTVAAFWILRPFMAATIWATMIVVVTWPLMLRLQRLLWQRRGLAIASMLVCLLLLVLAPLLLAVLTVVANSAEIASRAAAIASSNLPPPPHWIGELPFIGSKIVGVWNDATAAGIEGLWQRLVPYAGSLASWFVAEAGSGGYLAVQTLLTLFLAAFMYANGETAHGMVQRLGIRLAGKRGEALVHLSAQAIRGVALGVVVTAIIQSVLGGLGLAVAGVPFAGILTALLFVVCVAQIGMLVVLIPAVAWVFWSGHPGWGTALLIWSLAASLLDTVLRPYLVRRSADLPLLLIFVGVVGGLIAFGLIGIFVGPVILAVTYTLLMAWIDHPDTPTP